MRDLSNMKVTYLKGVLCSILLIIECPSIKTAVLEELGFELE